MTLSRLATALIALGFLAVQLAAVLYYLRHWGLRQTRALTLASHEGVYFKRYIPPALRSRYDRERIKQSQRRALRAGVLKVAVATAIGTGVAAVAVFAAIAAWPHVNWVELTAAETAALDYTTHGWVREPERTLPELYEVIALLRERGIVLIGAPEREHAGDGITATAAAQWRQFFSRHRIPVTQCRTPVLERCSTSRIAVLLPGYWRRASIERLLERGASVLLYGPPLQTVREQRPFALYELRFEPQRFFALPHLALVGDRTLTLGFDAGLVLPIEPTFKGYAAVSSDPQAVAIGMNRYVGGDIRARLHAQRAEDGRFVWMDFSPNATDHYAMLDERYLDAVLASAFGYLLKREQTAWASWPEGRRFAGIMSVDAEDQFSRVSMIAKLAREERMPITWFVLSNEAQRHRNALRELLEVGEIACHGDSHAAFPSVSASTQVARIARCRKVLGQLADANVIAFRPPYEEHNDATIDAVANNGMHYYFAVAGGDRAVPVIERSQTNGKTLVSLPRIGSDDFELWHARRLDVKASIEQADHELMWARTLGGFFAFDFHTQFMTPERMQVVRHYARSFKRADAHLGTAQDVARWWRFRDRLIRGETISAAHGCKYRPVLLRVDRNGELLRIAEPRSIAAALPSHGVARDPRWAAARHFCAGARRQEAELGNGGRNARK